MSACSVLAASCCQEAQIPSSLQICLTENYKESPVFAVQSSNGFAECRKFITGTWHRVAPSSSMSIKTLCVTFGFSLSSTWPYYQHHDPTKWQTETYQLDAKFTAQAPLGKKHVNMPHQQSIPGLWFYSLLKGFKHFLSNIDTHPHRLHCSALLLGFSPKNWIMTLPRSYRSLDVRGT